MRGATVRLVAAAVGLAGALAAAPAGTGTAATSAALEPVSDDTGTLSITVPSPWTAVVDGRPDELSSGTPVAVLLAVPGAEPFRDNAGPGVLVMSPEQPLDDHHGFLTEAEPTGCTPSAPPEAWTHPTLTGGLIASWTCGVVTHYEAVANTPDGQRFVWVQLNVTAPEEQFVAPILDSVAYTPAVPPGGDGAAASPPPTAPTVPPTPPPAGPTGPPTVPPTVPPAPPTGTLDVAAALAGLGGYTAAYPIGSNGAATSCPIGDAGLLAEAMRARGLEPASEVLGASTIALGEAWPAAPMVFCPMEVADLSMVPRASLYAADISGVATFEDVLAADSGTLMPQETPPFGGQLGGSCYDFEGRFVCWAMWHLDGLMLDVYVTAAPGAADERIAIDLLLALAPTLVANLAAV